MGRLASSFGRVLNACGLIAAVIILAMTGLIVADVALRNFPGLCGRLGLVCPSVVIRGSVELTEYALFLTTTLSAPWLLRQGRHIRIDLVLARVPPAAGWICELVCDVLGVTLAVLLSYYAIIATLKSARAGTLIVKDYIIPEWWAQWPLALMFVLLSIEFVFRLHRLANGPHQPRSEGGSA